MGEKGVQSIYLLNKKSGDGPGGVMGETGVKNFGQRLSFLETYKDDAFSFDYTFGLGTVFKDLTGPALCCQLYALGVALLKLWAILLPAG
jgi:hypothetical protein